MSFVHVGCHTISVESIIAMTESASTCGSSSRKNLSFACKNGITLVAENIGSRERKEVYGRLLNRSTCECECSETEETEAVEEVKAEEAPVAKATASKFKK